GRLARGNRDGPDGRGRRRRAEDPGASPPEGRLHAAGRGVGRRGLPRPGGAPGPRPPADHGRRAPGGRGSRARAPGPRPSPRDQGPVHLGLHRPGGRGTRVPRLRGRVPPEAVHGGVADPEGARGSGFGGVVGLAGRTAPWRAGFSWWTTRPRTGRSSGSSSRPRDTTS